jgi:hypothetical protein
MPVKILKSGLPPEGFFLVGSWGGNVHHADVTAEIGRMKFKSAMRQNS